MSNTKHTPGPLEIIEGNEGFYVKDSKNRTTAIIDYGFDDTEAGFDDMKAEEAKANATLYAAAPELLEALTSLYSKFKNDGLGHDKWYGPIMEQAKAAIKKATE